MSTDITQPWDTPVTNATITNNTSIYSSNNTIPESETTGNKGNPQYGLGKPTRIYIVGDIKHDID